MSKAVINQSLILLFSSVLIACAAPGETPETAIDDGVSSGTDCIFEGTIRDYKVLDESNLVVTASARRKYHIELFRPAFGLRSSWHIGFTSPTSRICPGFSEVVVDDSFGPEAIRISRIRALSPEAYEDLLIRFGKKQPEVVENPANEDVEDVSGAEVEELD